MRKPKTGVRDTALQLIDEELLWQAVVRRDAAHDGIFYYGVLSTGIYCRPSCPSRRPRRRNVRFYRTTGDAEGAGLRPCLRCHPRAVRDPEAVRISALCAYLEQHLDERLTLNVLSRQAGLSPFHLQRIFKKRTGVTPRQYADACRLKALKRRLREGRSVTRAMFDAGYGSTSRLYARTGPQLGMTPSEYRDGGLGVSIRYLTAATPLGFLLVAATDQGICSVEFGDSEPGLVEALRSEYPAAAVAASDSVLAGWVQLLLLQIAGKQPAPELPLDVRATAFERRVWEHLRSLPYGATASYGEVAAALGNPKAARAVARACAANPAALAIPCHRVIRGNGGLGGYRWGLERKKRLLDAETANEQRVYDRVEGR